MEKFAVFGGKERGARARRVGAEMGLWREVMRLDRIVCCCAAE